MYRRIQKTGKSRLFPLVGAPEGSVAPGLLALLKKWRKLEKKAELVVGPTQTFPRKAWDAVAQASRNRSMTRQALRQNFCAYAASLGVPAAVTAMWQGHSAAIAEQWYRTQVMGRIKADTIEEAMGLGTSVKSLI